MSEARVNLFDWLEQGRIGSARLSEALRISRVFPSAASWAAFVDRVLLGLGLVFILSGIVSFFAANWDEIGRFGRFLLIDGLILAALAFVWRLGLERKGGRAALFAASVLVGVLLGIVGQVYHTGADVYELFAVWAILILPWVILGRFPLLWIFWLGLVNLSVYLYTDTFHLFLGLFVEPRLILWVFFGLNTFALLAWEVAASQGVSWLRARWAPRILATAGGVPLTVLMIQDIFEWQGSVGLLDSCVWLVWLAAGYFLYRRLWVDVFMLAGGLLSLIVIVVAALMRAMFDAGFDAIGLLFTALLVLAMSSAGGWWLTRVAQERGIR